MTKKGFTLIELIIVITILAVLAGAMIPLFTTTRRQAQDAKAQADLDSVKSAAVMYKYDTRTWPQSGTTGTLTCLVSTGTGCPTAGSGWTGPYLTNWANDPYTSKLPYAIFVSGTVLYAQSFGPDTVSQGCGLLCPNTTGSACDQCVIVTADNTK